METDYMRKQLLFDLVLLNLTRLKKSDTMNFYEKERRFS